MVSKDQVGTGNSGVYDKASDTVVLLGDVTLSQGPNVTKGDRLVYDLKTGQAQVFAKPGHDVISIFEPQSNTDKTAPPPPTKRTAPARGSRSEAATQ